MKAGDSVRLIRIPEGLVDSPELKTRTLFEKCLGKSFVIHHIESFAGVSHKFAALDVGHIVGQESYMQTIVVEDEYLEIEKPG